MTDTIETGSARRAVDWLTVVAHDPALRAQHAQHVTDTGTVRFSVTYLSGPDGSVQIDWCDDCRLVRVFCEHRDCTWKAAGTALICDLCGEDLT